MWSFTKGNSEYRSDSTEAMFVEINVFKIWATHRKNIVPPSEVKLEYFKNLSIYQEGSKQSEKFYFIKWKTFY